MQDDLNILKAGAVALVACATCQLIPKARPLGGGITQLGFYYDFSLPAAIDSNFLRQIQDRMHQLVFLKKPIGVLHMMRENAAALLKSMGFFERAKAALLQPWNVIDLIDLDGFKDFIPFSCPASTQGLKHTVLTSLESLQGRSEKYPQYRISGLCCLDKESVKKTVKALDSYPKKSHLYLGEQMGLFSFKDEFCIWHQAGLLLRQNLQNFWQTVIAQEGISLISLQRTGFGKYKNLTFQEKRAFFFNALGSHLPQGLAEMAQVEEKEGEAAGLLSTPCYTTDLGYLFISPQLREPQLISSLHFIVQIIKIFAFEYEVILYTSSDEQASLLMKRACSACGCEIDHQKSLDPSKKEGVAAELCFSLSDLLGRRWPGPALTLYQDEELKSASLMTFTLFHSLERVIALLIEQKQGWLPVWLTPQQVRVCAFDSNLAKEEAQKLQTKNVRADWQKVEKSTEDTLKEMREARIPYAYLPQEEQVWALYDMKPMQMSLIELIEKINKESNLEMIQGELQ